MDTKTRLVLTLWVVGFSHGLPLAEEQHSDTCVPQLLARLEADINANKAEIKQMKDTLTGKLQGKAVLTSDTPAFMLTLSSTFDHCSENQPVLFDAVELNQCGGYDQETRFILGTKDCAYQISTTISSSPLGTGYHVALVKNSVNNHVGYLIADGQLNHYEMQSTSIILHMDAGDDIWVSCLGYSSMIGHPSLGYRDHYLSTFSGFMISEE